MNTENNDIQESVKQESKKKHNWILKFLLIFIIIFITLPLMISIYPGHKMSLTENVVCSLILSFVWYMAFLSEHKYEYRHFIDVIRRFGMFIGAILIIGCVLISIIACLLGI